MPLSIPTPSSSPTFRSRLTRCSIRSRRIPKQFWESPTTSRLATRHTSSSTPPDGNLSLAVWQLNEGPPLRPGGSARAGCTSRVHMDWAVHRQLHPHAAARVLLPTGDHRTGTRSPSRRANPSGSSATATSCSSSSSCRSRSRICSTWSRTLLSPTGLEIIYHGQWGFPIYIDVDPVANAVDEEYHYDVIDFVLTQ